MPQKTSREASERGAALLVVTIVAVLMGGMALGLITENLAETRAVDTQRSAFFAREIAEAGLAMAEVEIRGHSDPDGDGVGTLTRAYAGGMVQVRAVPHASAADRWILTAIGEYQQMRRQVEVGVRRRTRQRHVEGLYSKEPLVVTGDVKTDGYDSRLGSYSTQASNLDTNGDWYALNTGHVGSGMGIDVQGSSVGIRGNAIPGTEYSVEVNENALITGDHLPRLHPMDLPDPSLAEFQAAFASNQNEELYATEAFGADEAEMQKISDKELKELPSSELESLPKADMMLLGEDQVGDMLYADLVQEVYATLLGVAPDKLNKTVTENEKYYKDAIGKLYPDPVQVELVPIDDDDYMAPEGGTSAPEYVIPETTLEKPPGRVSYDATTRELRASAGAAVVLDGGTYAFSDLRLVGGAYLSVRGPSTIYVTGKLDLSGGAILNESGRPGDLKIVVHPHAIPGMSTPSETWVKMRGGSIVAASLYAPGADVSIGGNGHFFGSIVGKSISMLGSVSYHYDEALAVQHGLGSNYELLYWRELTPHVR